MSPLFHCLIVALWITIGFFAARWVFLLEYEHQKEIEMRGDDVMTFVMAGLLWPMTMIVCAVIWFDRSKNHVWFTIKRK
jgi:hypothetical protein